MKTLLVLRHAKSSWSDPALDDHDRPLNPRGLRDAPRIGRLLEREDLIPELVLCSTARRARTTARLVLAASDREVELRPVPELYLADPATYVRTLAAVDDGVERVMVVGHNPGLEDLVAALTGRRERMPTAALAHLQCAFPGWGELERPPGCELVRVWRPKQLEDP